jgi:hypothetical protein
MQDTSLDDDDDNSRDDISGSNGGGGGGGGGGKSGKGGKGGKGERRIPKAGRGEGGRGKPMAPKPRVKKPPVDLSIGRFAPISGATPESPSLSSSSPSSSSGLAPLSRRKPPALKKQRSQLDAMVGPSQGEDALEDLAGGKGGGSDSDEVDADVHDSDSHDDDDDDDARDVSEGRRLLEEAAAVGEGGGLGDAASSEEDPVSDDDDAAAAGSHHPLPPREVARRLLEAVRQPDSGALRQAAACAVSKERAGGSDAAAWRLTMRQGREVVAALDVACSKSAAVFVQTSVSFSLFLHCPFPVFRPVSKMPTCICSCGQLYFPFLKES